MRERIREIIVQTCAEMGAISCKVCWAETMCICSCRYRQSWPCPTSCSASKVARRDGSKWSSLSCASATGEEDFGPEVISQPPLEMSMTISSRSIWNYRPLNDASGVSRQRFTYLLREIAQNRPPDSYAWFVLHPGPVAV